MKRLALAFSDHMAPFEGRDSLWTHLLRDRYDLVVEGDFAKANLLIYGDSGTKHQSFHGRKIYYTIENMLPDYNECDFAITSNFRPDDSRHFRLPYYAYSCGSPAPLLKGPEFDARKLLQSKTGFCCFVVTNPRSPERNRFFKMLSQRKHVDSAGRHFNNMGVKISDKKAFVSKYKFVIAFENTATPGYTTEKIIDAMKAGTIPIYWGNPEIGREFNTRSFINVMDFPSYEAAIEHILRVDADDELYLQYLREPWFAGNQLPEAFQWDRLTDALVRFIETGAGPGPRVYRNRRLREHIYGSPLEQTWISLKCRLESKLWDLGLRL